MELGKQLDCILACETKEQLFGQLNQIAIFHGFSSVSYVAARPQMLLDGGLIDFVTSAPTQFIQNYADEQFLTVDPVVYRAASTSLPFRWSDCPEFDAFWTPRSGPAGDAVRVMEAAWDHGFSEGFVVPTHTVVAGQTISGFATFFWPDKHAGPALTSKDTLLLRIVANTAHEKYIRLCGVDGGRTDKVDLSDRERDCLCWAARGKSSAETGEILKLSTRTVEHHIASATRKLKAVNKLQAVVIALQQGKILP